MFIFHQMISNQPLILNSLDADFSVAPWSFFDLPLLIAIFVLATIESPAPKNLREQNYFKIFPNIHAHAL